MRIGFLRFYSHYLRCVALATTLQDVRLELAKDDAVSLAQGVVFPHDITLTTLLITGLNLEGQQCVVHNSFPLQGLTFKSAFRRQLQLEVSQIKGTRTSKQLADLEGKRSALQNRIQRWREAQLVYMPCVGTLLARTLTTTNGADSAESPSIEPAEAIPLYLPSSLPQRLRRLPELSAAVERERRLRVAQADDALADIRRQRQIISGIWQFKKLNTDGTGNKACTRMRALYNRFSFRTQRCAGEYRAARNALVTLDLGGSWESRLQVLKDTDIRGPGKDDDEAGNGCYEPSWIWLIPRSHSTPGTGTSEQVLDESLHIEWSKSYARKLRWEEEALLVQEEMRRVITYHEWSAQWWRSQAARRSNTDNATLHGISAYAEKQAYLSSELARQSALFWLPFLKEKGIMPEWGDRYSMSCASMPQLAFTDEDMDDDDDDDDDVGCEETEGNGEEQDLEGSDFDDVDLCFSEIDI